MASCCSKLGLCVSDVAAATSCGVRVLNSCPVCIQESRRQLATLVEYESYTADMRPCPDQAVVPDDKAKKIQEVYVAPSCVAVSTLALAFCFGG